MSRREKGWGLVILVVVILGYLIPFTLLKEVTFWYGSFLVWVLLALIVIAINVILTKDWGDRS